MLTLLTSLTALVAVAPQLTFTSQRTQARPVPPPALAPIFRETSATALPYAPTLFGRGVCATDIDRDGHTDFVIATATGAVLYRNTGHATFQDESSARLPMNLAAIFGGALKPIAGDVNSDGWVDLVLLAEDPNQPDALLLGRAPGVFQAPVSLPMRTAVTSDAVLVDVDGDGDLDLVRSVGSSGHMAAAGRDGLAFNDGTGRFTESSSFIQAPWNSDSIASTGVLSLDANGDGVIDLFITRADPGGSTGMPGAKNQLLFGTGGGAFIDGTARLPDLFDNSFGAVALDLEGDGDLDIVVANTLLGVSGASSGDVLVNQGGIQGGSPGTYLDRFDALDEFPSPSEAIRLGLLSADVDLDGRTDVLFRIHDLPPGGGQPLYLGVMGVTAASPGFVRESTFYPGSFIAAGGAFADIDGDGDADLLLTAAGSAGGGSPLGTVRIFVNGTR